ncbi:MAG: hypothetical protein HF982_13560 [Desulfobacteraceae bacterium]|nr:hypothetical protein [Desulfobacteraceae bacterium]MBC2720586.1 hypothetical protein [Desulfobacteraceae bacterium]
MYAGIVQALFLIEHADGRIELRAFNLVMGKNFEIVGSYLEDKERGRINFLK